MFLVIPMLRKYNKAKDTNASSHDICETYYYPICAGSVAKFL